MKIEEKIFKRNVKRRKERTKEKVSVLSLVEKIVELNEILPCIKEPMNKTSMKYLSNLYSELLDPIRNVTMYMVQKGYSGLDQAVDDAIIRIEELVSILRKFNELNTVRKACGFIDDSSQIESSCLLKALRKKMDEVLALRAIISREIGVFTSN